MISLRCDERQASRIQCTADELVGMRSEQCDMRCGVEEVLTLHTAHGMYELATMYEHSVATS